MLTFTSGFSGGGGVVPSSLHYARANSPSIMASIIRSENLDMIDVCRINVGFLFSNAKL